MLKADIHTHSYFSSDSDTPLGEMVQTAVDAGLEIYCITEHMDIDHHIYNGHTAPDYGFKDKTKEEVEKMFICDTDSFLKEFTVLREKYAGRIKLLFGMELGLQPGLGAKFRDLAERYPFDYLIGSGHEAGHQDPYYSLFFKGFDTPVQAIRFYFQEVLEGVKDCCESMDCLGHLDYVLRYHRPEGFVFCYDDYADILDELLYFLIENEKALECNSGSFRYFDKDAQPIECVLKRYHELGGRLVCAGSDAHNPSRVADGLDTIEEMLKRCGFDRVAVFENRKPSLIPF